MRFTDVESAACSALIWSREDHKILLLLRSESSSEPMTWCLPGGHLEAGEDWDQALHRELHEEIGIGLDDRPKSLLCTSSTVTPGFQHRAYAICVDKTFRPRLNWEHADFAWRPLDELPDNLSWGLSMLLHNEEAAIRLHDFKQKYNKIGQ